MEIFESVKKEIIRKHALISIKEAIKSYKENDNKTHALGYASGLLSAHLLSETISYEELEEFSKELMP